MGGGINPVDTDGDNTPDILDADSDNDGVPDNNEGHDYNFDGQPDNLFSGTDTDNDGLDDAYEGNDINDGYDVNDEIEVPLLDLPNTDSDEEPNYRDLDDDGDEIPTPEEDMNGDGDPTNDDSDGDGTPDFLDDTDDCARENIAPSTAVTFNGDGINDFFEVRGVETCGFTFNVLIFNRWGNKVFEATNYQNDWGGFSPENSVGSSGTLPSGTYYYIITIPEKPEWEPINGFFYLGSR